MSHSISSMSQVRMSRSIPSMSQVHTSDTRKSRQTRSCRFSRGSSPLDVSVSRMFLVHTPSGGTALVLFCFKYVFRLTGIFIFMFILLYKCSYSILLYILHFPTHSAAALAVVDLHDQVVVMSFCVVYLLWDTSAVAVSSTPIYVLRSLRHNEVWIKITTRIGILMVVATCNNWNPALKTSRSTTSKSSHFPRKHPHYSP